MGYENLFVALNGEYSRKECVKIDTITQSTQIDFSLKNSLYKLNFCYQTNIYLASIEEYIYTKITTVNPYYIIMNNSKKQILIQQSENPDLNQFVPMMLEPG